MIEERNIEMTVIGTVISSPSRYNDVAKYILDNYQEIQKKMEKNVLPTKDDMIKQISNIINQ